MEAASAAAASSGPASCDLFSEIHLNELQKLEKQLESSEADKSQLSMTLKETKESLEKTRGELTSQQVRVIVCVWVCVRDRECVGEIK